MARCLRRLGNMVKRVIIANGEGQFVDLATLDLNSKRGETLADLACVEHIGAAFQNRCKRLVARPCAVKTVSGLNDIVVKGKTQHSTLLALAFVPEKCYITRCSSTKSCTWH